MKHLINAIAREQELSFARASNILRDTTLSNCEPVFLSRARNRILSELEALGYIDVNWQAGQNKIYACSNNLIVLPENRGYSLTGTPAPGYVGAIRELDSKQIRIENTKPCEKISVQIGQAVWIDAEVPSSVVLHGDSKEIARVTGLNINDSGIPTAWNLASYSASLSDFEKEWLDNNRDYRTMNLQEDRWLDIGDGGENYIRLTEHRPGLYKVKIRRNQQFSSTGYYFAEQNDIMGYSEIDKAWGYWLQARLIDRTKQVIRYDKKRKKLISGGRLPKPLERAAIACSGKLYSYSSNRYEYNLVPEPVARKIMEKVE